VDDANMSTPYLERMAREQAFDAHMAKNMAKADNLMAKLD
jgi:hypothetical protein